MKSLTAIRARRRRSRGSGEDGFSLIETVVAMAIAAGVFMAFSATLITTLKGGMVARQNQQAADMLTQQVETLRSYPFSAASMVTSDPTLSSDSNIVGSTFNSGTGAEPLVIGAVGSVSPHVNTSAINGTTYTVATYVTKVTDAVGGNERRGTVVVTWSAAGNNHRKQFSTLLTDTVRGLPLPRFNLSATSPISNEQTVGAAPYFGFKIVNVGARDAWNLVASTGTYAYYNDNVDCDGVLDSGAVQLTDTGGDGVVDTGLVEPNANICVVAVRSPVLQPGEAPGSFSVTFTATSVAQPLATTAVKSLTYTELVDQVPPGTSVGAGGSIDKYYLYNNAFGGLTNGTADTTTLSQMAMSSANGAAPYATRLSNYSTDISAGSSPNQVGRYLQGGGSDNSNSATKLADWRTQVSKATTFQGVGLVQVWIACAAGSSGSATLYTEIGTANNASGNITGQTVATPTTVSCGSSFAQVSLPLGSANFSVSKNKYWSLAIWSTNSSANIRMMYDNTTYKALVYMPQMAP